MENWKDIKGYPDYQISDLGRVKSFKLKTNLEGKLMTGSPDGSGYLCVTLKVSESVRTEKIHKLVAMAFLKHEPCGHELVIDHISNDKKDNRLINLQLISNRKNCSKDVKSKTSKYTGVMWNKQCNKWTAQISINKKRKHLGMFTNEYDAHIAYEKELSAISSQLQ